MKHLPNSQAVLCASIDRDCHKERVSTRIYKLIFTISLFEIMKIILCIETISS